MGREEAFCWLGRALHRKHPWWVPTAFGILCTGLTAAPTMKAVS